MSLTIELFNFFKDRAMLIDKDALNNWNNGVCELFSPENIYCEIKGLHYPKIVELLHKNHGGKVVGLDKSFQRRICKEHNGDKFYLTYQILSSVLGGCSYIGFGGAGNLLSSALPVKLILFGDDWDYMPEQQVYFKNLFNAHFYGESFPCLNSICNYSKAKFNQPMALEFIDNYFKKYLPESKPTQNIILKGCQEIFVDCG